MFPHNPHTAFALGIVVGLVVVPAAARALARRRSAPVSR